MQLHRKAGLYNEPSLADVFADPIVQRVMARDHVNPDDLRTIIIAARRHRLTVRPLRTGNDPVSPEARGGWLCRLSGLSDGVLPWLGSAIALLLLVAVLAR